MAKSIVINGKSHLSFTLSAARFFQALEQPVEVYNTFDLSPSQIIALVSQGSELGNEFFSLGRCVSSEQITERIFKLRLVRVESLLERSVSLFNENAERLNNGR